MWLVRSRSVYLTSILFILLVLKCQKTLLSRTGIANQLFDILLRRDFLYGGQCKLYHWAFSHRRSFIGMAFVGLPLCRVAVYRSSILWAAVFQGKQFSEVGDHVDFVRRFLTPAVLSPLIDFIQFLRSVSAAHLLRRKWWNINRCGHWLVFLLLVFVY